MLFSLKSMNICVQYSHWSSCFKHAIKKLLFGLITTLWSCYKILRNVKVKREIHFDFVEMLSQINSGK